MSTSVKHIHSAMRGAPAISGSAGTLIAALDAFFVSGWGVTTALSVSVASGVATATLTPGQTFDRDAVVLVEGATPGALNGEARVATTSNTSITWATTAADGAATGTITIKYAPCTAWSKVHAGTNKADYRSTHVASAQHHLRIDDTGTTTARVRGFETMSDVDTGVGPFPTDAQMSGGGYWWKSALASGVAVKYRIFADERFVIVAIAAGFSQSATFLASSPRGFGDPLPLAPGGDAWATLLSAAGLNSSSTGNSSLVNQNIANANGFTAAPRAFTGLGGSVYVTPRSFTSLASTSYTGQDTVLGALPSAVDGQVKPARVFVSETDAGKPPRAVFPGCYYLPQSGALTAMADGDILTGAGELAGRKLIALADVGSGGYSALPTGMYLVDLTGPWR